MNGSSSSTTTTTTTTTNNVISLLNDDDDDDNNNNTTLNLTIKHYEKQLQQVNKDINQYESKLRPLRSRREQLIDIINKKKNELSRCSLRRANELSFYTVLCRVVMFYVSCLSCIHLYLFVQFTFISI